MPNTSLESEAVSVAAPPREELADFHDGLFFGFSFETRSVLLPDLLPDFLSDFVAGFFAGFVVAGFCAGFCAGCFAGLLFYRVLST